MVLNVIAQPSTYNTLLTIIFSYELYIQCAGRQRARGGYTPDGLHDRNLANLTPKNQRGFISVFIVPFHTLVADMFKKMEPVRDYAKENFEYWLELCNSESSNDNSNAARSSASSVETKSSAPTLSSQSSVNNTKENPSRSQHLKTWKEQEVTLLPHLNRQETADSDTADEIRSRLASPGDSGKESIEGRRRRHKYFFFVYCDLRA